MTTSTVQDLFRDANGYTASSIGRMRMGSSADPAFTYGEVTPESIDTVLKFVPYAQGETFVDLGSGTGKAVLYAAFLGQFGKTVGVELLDELHQTAQGVHGRYESEVRPFLAHPQNQTQIEFRQGDIFNIDYSDADVVFGHCCTCFPDELMEKLSKNLEQLKPGARVVCVTRSVNSDKFAFLGSAPCQMGWGMATLNLYQRI